MKKNFFLLALLSLPFLLTSCGDDDSTTVKNGFNYNGEFYAVDMNFDIFTSPGDRTFMYTFKANYDETTQIISGSDMNFIRFNWEYNPSVSTLPVGTYTFNADDSTAGTFKGKLGIGYNSSTLSATKEADFTGGTVDVTVKTVGTKLIYTLVFNITTNSGPVSGTINLERDDLIVT